MASGSGMNRAGLKGHDMDFLVVQDFPGHGLAAFGEDGQQRHKAQHRAHGNEQERQVQTGFIFTHGRLLSLNLKMVC